ncbi:MAG: DUF2974 domain-containing protein, partial [Parasporobacterium sp.]|nr:DUF2974 domain-containing protein [Parasporobacterium sp.]
LRDKYGNLYVHYRGTGDGCWEYNTAVYKDEPSSIQVDAVRFFDHVVETYWKDNGDNKLIVSGHSQGGNNAQYVTLHSAYGDKIDTCISMDGPNHSKQSIEDVKNAYGEEWFEKQRNKIFAFNGTSDYVSELGQENIIPEGHTVYIKTPWPDEQPYQIPYTNTDQKNKTPMPFEIFHASTYLLHWEDGKLVLNEETEELGDFRLFVRKFAEKIKTLPPEDQAIAATVMMQLVENGIGSRENYIDPENFERFKELFVSILVEVMDEDMELTEAFIRSLNIDEMAFGDGGKNSSATTDTIINILRAFNDLPYDMREEALRDLAELIHVKESESKDGQMEFVFPDEVSDVLNLSNRELLAAGFLSLMKEMREHPEDAARILSETKFMQAYEKALRDHPVMAFAAAVLFPTAAVILHPEVIYAGVTAIVRVAAGAFDVLYKVVDFMARGLSVIKKGYEALKNAFEKAFAYVEKWIKKVGEDIHAFFNKGVDYVTWQTYFCIDTTKYENLANRLDRVNKRLEILDRDMNDLYWQVGFLDLWDILAANLITGYSPTLSQVSRYLRNTAARFSDAENRIAGMFDGS